MGTTEGMKALDAITHRIYMGFRYWEVATFYLWGAILTSWGPFLGWYLFGPIGLFLVAMPLSPFGYFWFYRMKAGKEVGMNFRAWCVKNPEIFAAWLRIRKGEKPI